MIRNGWRHRRCSCIVRFGHSRAFTHKLCVHDYASKCTYTSKSNSWFNSSHEYLSASRSPLFKPPSGDKVVELFRTLGGVWKFRKGDQDGDVHAEVFPSSYLGCDMTVNEASH